MWFIYALIGAIGKSYSGLFRKKIAKDVSGSMYIWVSYSLILLALTPFMLAQIPSIKDALIHFPLVVFGAALSHMIGTQLNLEALKREDLSYTAPLNAFVPVFTLLIALLFLDESPPALGYLGVAIVVIGAYIVSIQPDNIRWYDPLKRLTSSAGAQLSVGVGLFYAINTVLMKALTNNGFSVFIVLYITTFAGWLLLLNVPISKQKEFKAIAGPDKLMVLGGARSSFVGGLFHILAIASTFTSFAASVRRLDAVISVLLGWRYLKEKSIRVKLTGSVVMTVGAIVMLVS